MSPEILSQISLPAAIGLSGLAMAGGAAVARFSGPVACAWPARGAALLRRLNAVKVYRRPSLARSVGGGVLVAAVLAGGGLAAYAAGPSRPGLAALPARLAVLTPARVAGLIDPAPRGETPALASALAAAEAPGPQTIATPALSPPVAALAAAEPTFTQSSRNAYLIKADDSNYAQVRADILNNVPWPLVATIPASPTLVGPLSVYAPAGAYAPGLIAQAFPDPRGTWEVGEPDAQGGVIITRTSTIATIRWGGAGPAPNVVLSGKYLPLSPSQTAEAATAAPTP